MEALNNILPKNEMFRRYFIFVVSLFFYGLGISFTKHGGLGVSPISSVANVVSEKFTGLSFGTWLFISNMFMLFMQIVLLRSRFQKIQLLQIPLSLIFGFFTDLGGLIANRFPVDRYSFQWMSIAIGTMILAFGIAMCIVANVVINSGEALVKAISDLTGFKFGNVKIAFDICWVAISCALSLYFFDMHLVGIREGTIFAGIFTGVFAKFFLENIRGDLERFIKSEV